MFFVGHVLVASNRNKKELERLTADVPLAPSDVRRLLVWYNDVVGLPVVHKHELSFRREVAEVNTEFSKVPNIVEPKLDAHLSLELHERVIEKGLELLHCLNGRGRGALS